MNILQIFLIVKGFLSRNWKSLIIVLTPILLLPLAVTGNKAMQCGYIIGIVAIFWITEVMNLAVTSLIPIVLFPAFGILTPSTVAACYMKFSADIFIILHNSVRIFCAYFVSVIIFKDITLMLIGGLIVAKTVEKQNLHKRLAIRILKLMGPNPIFQYLGFMLSTWFLSMWISNTATTAMMITLADAVVEQWKLMEQSNHDENLQSNGRRLSESAEFEMKDLKNIYVNTENEESINFEMKRIDKFGKGLFLCIAYAATCGGIATLPGTAPNLVFYGFMDERYKDKMKLNFGSFILFSFPLSVIIVILCWMLLCIRYVGISSIFKRKIDPQRDKKSMKLIDEELSNLGSFRFGEISTLLVFMGLVLLWVLREPGIPLLGKLFTFKNSKGESVQYWTDSLSAILAALFVFNLPANNPFKDHNGGKNEKLIDWKYIEKGFSWGLVFLFGGGFALAAGCENSGLSPIIGDVLTKLNSLPHYAIILIISLGISFLTEITSNTATVTILLPIMLKMAECIRMHPMKIGLAVTIACSFSFCLPAATPPNAIVFSTGKLRVVDMATSGFLLNIICVLVLSIMVHFYSVPIFNTNEFPDWIQVNCSKI